MYNNIINAGANYSNIFTVPKKNNSMVIQNKYCCRLK